MICLNAGDDEGIAPCVFVIVKVFFLQCTATCAIIQGEGRDTMDYNYHTHTARCHHAVDTAEEYIERAVSCGIKYMGFSDHAPFPHPDGKEAGYRVCVAEGKAYCDEIKALKEKYKEKIDIKVGFEMEYFPDSFPEMLERVKSYGAEYLILGQHFAKEEYYHVPYAGVATDDMEYLKLYVKTVIEGMATGKFTYVAHPDLIRYTGNEEIYKEEMRKICIASRECGIPLEINFLGIYDGRHYPNEEFWAIAAEEKSPVTFGLDAHGAKRAYDGKSLIKAEEMVKRLGLNYIGKPDILFI